MNTISNIDKRKFKRIKGEFNIRIIEKDESEIDFSFEKGKSIDISGSGILFHYHKPLQINKLINVRFLRPNSFDFFESNARVIRVELNTDNITYDIGIELIELGLDDEKKLEYYLLK